jgi:hypothetical protein
MRLSQQRVPSRPDVAIEDHQAKRFQFYVAAYPRQPATEIQISNSACCSHLWITAGQGRRSPRISKAGACAPSLHWSTLLVRGPKAYGTRLPPVAAAQLQSPVVLYAGPCGRQLDLTDG